MKIQVSDLRFWSESYSNKEKLTAMRSIYPVRLRILVLSLLLFSCAAIYKPPVISPPSPDHGFLQKSKSELFNASLTVLAEEGFTITLSDRESGVISTCKKQTVLTEKDCDCGTAMKWRYIKDKRTITSVAINVMIKDGNVSLKTTISGQYLPNDPFLGNTFTCISTGIIEKNIIQKIKTKF